ncbi:flagellar protein [Clostridioides sp. ZZV14-6154]|nr:flagellar protein [Clostridioides sp. ZZV14-6150]MCC0661011.1 flagellar protein [Clostridioides sp. ZZV14-6154]MCC0668273.1 flagellar protein [Clostridioides sp. ZZV14-6153]MCC0718152.1 flagellar protein [Clostridioides sp. ZZV14-6105]MCC0722568.1 flagellar protein [Clostridioides sp. ZZV14-6104]MCC0727078.1 flagellar protein [Clostridioides sp. ZZV14-6045]MCC0729863.1 flagellar protein [Clostridioides sp. ZZV14-6048]MCC0734745.1 flagellar protein [Clostridioides sp. ZZV14-6009]MCC073825
MVIDVRIQIILIVVSILIIVTIIANLHKESKNKDNRYFDKIFEQEYEANDRLIVAEKRRFFLDKVLAEIRSNNHIKIYENYSLMKTNEEKKEDIFIESKQEIKQENELSLKVKHLINSGYDDVEICKMLDIGKGELSLIRSCYKI